jgi:hypothetical protein
MFAVSTADGLPGDRLGGFPRQPSAFLAVHQGSWIRSLTDCSPKRGSVPARLS